MRNRIVINKGVINRAKEYAEEFTDNFIYHGGIEIESHYFVPVCKKCSSQHLKKLKNTCRIKDKTYSYSCSKCKSPAEVDALPIK
jgi:RNase P subunit RPR2